MTRDLCMAFTKMKTSNHTGKLEDFNRDVVFIFREQNSTA